MNQNDVLICKLNQAMDLLEEIKDKLSSRTNNEKTQKINWDLREKLIFGPNIDYNAENYKLNGGVKHFDKMKPETADTLISFGFLDRYETQNNSPTVEEFLKFIDDHPEEDWYLHGYSVSPERKDVRVSIEGIGCKNCLNPKTVIDFLKLNRVDYCADDIRAENDGTLYCWYD